MKFALGTFEISDEQANVIAKDLGKRGSYVKRDEARDWALGLINNRLNALNSASTQGVTASASASASSPISLDEELEQDIDSLD